MHNQLKYEEFDKIVKEFNEQLGSMPILYGSLGLSKALNKDLKTDDIDMLVEHSIFTSRLEEIRRLMNSLGYDLTDPEENEFRKGMLKVGIAMDGDMLDFSGINPRELMVTYHPANYRVLTPKQYLATYKASSLDGYRKDVHEKDDFSKIQLIESTLSV